MKPRTVKIIKLKKKYAILLIVALLLVFGIVAGVSYAFFTSTVAGKEYVVYSGNLEIAYEKKTDVINLQAAKPMTNTEGLATTPYSFDVKNIGTLTTKYQVRLETDNSNTLPLEYVKVSVYKNDIQYLKPTKLSDLNSTLVIVDNGLLETSASDNYKVRLWVDINAGNDMVGKVFKAKVVIDGMQNVADGFDVNTRPIITLNKLNDETHINLVQGNTFTDPGVESVKDDKDVLKKSDITTTYEYYDGTNLTTVNNIDTNNTGVYYITYSILDKEGLAGQTIRVVTVNPTETVPTIALNGDASVTLQEEDTYTEQGATVAEGVQVAIIGEVKTNIPGTYVVKYIAIDQNGNMNSVTRTVTVNRRTVWDFDYTGDVQTFTVPYAGTYKLETWGAQGGHNNSNSNVNYGGYSTGTILLEKDKILKVVVGESPTSNIGGYNGGGTGLNDGAQSGYGGGGATHIAKNDENNYSVLSSYTNETNARNYVYIVAGAGGGTGINTNGNHLVSGGAGGGLNGIDGSYASQYPTYVGHGGTQTTAGALCAECTNTGSFGTGGNYCLSNFSAPGGGAGWYGGSGTSRYHAGAGGGSSYIGGVNDGQTIAGNQTITEPDGATATGHKGNGYARITYIGNN